LTRSLYWKPSKKYNRGPATSFIPESTQGKAAGWSGETGPIIGGWVAPERMDGIAAHEEMHATFQKIREEYGNDVCNALIQHLLSFSNPIAIRQINSVLLLLGYDPRENNFAEEVVIYHHTYLTDHVNRRRIKKLTRVSRHEGLDARELRQVAYTEDSRAKGLHRYLDVFLPSNQVTPNMMSHLFNSIVGMASMIFQVEQEMLCLSLLPRRMRVGNCRIFFARSPHPSHNGTNAVRITWKHVVSRIQPW
jgi:hypothetical protein